MNALQIMGTAVRCAPTLMDLSIVAVTVDFLSMLMKQLVMVS